MRRWETLLALAAVVAASLGALPFHGRAYFTYGGVALLIVVGGSVLWRSLARGGTQATNAAKRAARIREQRRRR
jgi:hypothetical protein